MKLRTLGMPAVLAFLGWLPFSCGIVDPKIDNSLLDGDVIVDTAAMISGDALLSSYVSAPTPAQLAMPVIVAAHGFTATTFEWLEFRNFADSCGDFFVSQVLLGGHGRSYEDFKASTWEIWQAPIIAEYRRLDSIGYTNISLAGSSTGGALILEILSAGKLKNLQRPNHVFMVDAIVIPSSKLLSLIPIMGPIIGTSISEGTEAEKPYWYTNRPEEALNQLMEVITKVRKDLEDGIKLPSGTGMTVFKAKYDASADPVSALLIYKGTSPKPQIEMVESRKHVFTRLNGRDPESITDADWQNQRSAFVKMRQTVLN